MPAVTNDFFFHAWVADYGREKSFLLIAGKGVPGRMEPPFGRGNKGTVPSPQGNAGRNTRQSRGRGDNILYYSLVSRLNPAPTRPTGAPSDREGELGWWLCERRDGGIIYWLVSRLSVFRGQRLHTPPLRHRDALPTPTHLPALPLAFYKS